MRNYSIAGILMQAPHPPDFMVFTGNANPAMAVDIASHLNISLGAATVGRFSDGEVTVEINQNVRARDVFVVQSTCCLFYTSDAADDLLCVDLGGRRIIKKK